MGKNTFKITKISEYYQFEDAHALNLRVTFARQNTYFIYFFTLADRTSCTICVIVQDGIDLITMTPEDRVSLKLLAS
jgi:predicted dithiol-disulfide oxidoreductase (DUF899 family)